MVKSALNMREVRQMIKDLPKSQQETTVPAEGAVDDRNTAESQLMCYRRKDR